MFIERHSVMSVGRIVVKGSHRRLFCHNWMDWRLSHWQPQRRLNCVHRVDHLPNLPIPSQLWPNSDRLSHVLVALRQKGQSGNCVSSLEALYWQPSLHPVTKMLHISYESWTWINNYIQIWKLQVISEKNQKLLQNSWNLIEMAVKHNRNCFNWIIFYGA